MGVVSLKVGMVKQKFLPLFAHRIRTPLLKILDPLLIIHIYMELGLGQVS